MRLPSCNKLIAQIRIVQSRIARLRLQKEVRSAYMLEVQQERLERLQTRLRNGQCEDAQTYRGRMKLFQQDQVVIINNRTEAQVVKVYDPHTIEVFIPATGIDIITDAQRICKIKE